MTSKFEYAISFTPDELCVVHDACSQMIDEAKHLKYPMLDDEFIRQGHLIGAAAKVYAAIHMIAGGQGND